METKNFIEILQHELKRNQDLEDIIIFGSAARTNFQKFNDIDILIVFQNYVDLSEMPSSLKDIEEFCDVKISPLLDYGGKNPVFNYIGVKEKGFNYISGKSKLNYIKNKAKKTLNYGGIKPILNYNAGKNRIFNYIKGEVPLFNYQSGKSLFHVFYCKKSEMNPKHQGIMNPKIFDEGISIRELEYAPA